MNKRFWISGFVMAVASLAVGFVVHGLLLHDDYAKLSNLFRSETEAQRYFPFMLLANLLMGFGMTWMYQRGVSTGKSLVAQGIPFGLGLAGLMIVPWYLIYYAVQPMPGGTVAKQIVFDVVGFVFLGLLVALLNRPPKAL